MKEQLQAIREEALADIDRCTTVAALNEVRIGYMGKKGKVTSILKGMGKLSKEERPIIGQLANEVRDAIGVALEEKQTQLASAALEARLTAEKIDITMPGRAFPVGSVHPLTQVIRDAERIFAGLGFEVAHGPEIESDYYNFEALNLSKDHPARDMQDTFYINPNVLLRTQTSPVQVRTMEHKGGLAPVKIICPGKVYRRDDDATHSPMFHQIEGLCVDEGITMGDLKGVLLSFIHQMFDESVQIRLRPSYFPFTEPSCEVDISCVNCGGKGCRVCSHTGWLEILGSGMVHPNVLRYGGYDPSKVSGFAFGMGVERIAMIKYGIDDLRLFFGGDLRFLSQFKEGLC
ncbi:MAG: phenylalanine--tRNA ligase subunit alpha [Clostridiales bacterium]|uniref:Phenylalanine--tRNA ligase alpha subunit n=1 Tax=Peptococcus niger TaxID=2741 RepID=A0A1G6X5E1_PEPNI|nr:phenylalanine--tRNA ligase subunit alpha [Peptococcus niger]MDU1029419.1 phenylalanine--tRNA ligase subunit alpha [Clostridiales bacterium]MDU2293188.1 phenylalanine--tRNA ligase subunit alpha [Peptococcus niger]MDU7245212.1 phenylalanine--tRNA ligase subunit alpha [Clostridiales bacterium]SDD72486.1 phenylalanyl-tRNA synthetase, alpha subunit [Peptococcus niger]